jgi:TonB family protein
MRSKKGVSDWLIQYAARRAPAALTERLREEWSADLESRPAGLSRLKFAFGCCWATQIIAFEQRPLAMQATASASAGGGYAGFYSRENVGFVSRRTSSFLLVALFHVAAIYVFALSYSHIHTKKPEGDIDLRPMEPEKKPPPVQTKQDIPNAHPDITYTRPEFTPVIVKDLPPPPDEVTVGDKESGPSGEPPLVQTHLPVRVAGGPGVGFPNVDDYYPGVEVFRGHEGVTTVRVCVDARGRLTSAPTAEESSGSALLDEGALRLAKAGSGHYRPSTEDGAPVASCYPYRIRFQLKK